MHCPAWQILCNPAFVLQYKYNHYFFYQFKSSVASLHKWRSLLSTNLFNSKFMSFEHQLIDYRNLMNANSATLVCFYPLALSFSVLALFGATQRVRS